MSFFIKLVVITFLICFGISEFYLRYTKQYIRSQIEFPFSREINSLQFRPLINNPGKPGVDYNSKFENEKNKFYIFLTNADKEYCTKNIPSITGRIFFKVNNEVIFDCHPTHDAFGRRVTTDHPTKPVDTHTIFIGGSRTYGWGLEDHQTVTSYYQKLHPETFVYNYAVPSNGLQMFIRQFEVGKISEQVQQKKGNIVYVLDHAHLRRFFPATDQIWVIHGPSYTLNEQDELEYAGSYWETDFFKSTVYYIFTMSAFFQKLKVNLPISLNDHDYMMVARGVEKLKKVVLNQFPDSTFTTVTFSNGTEIQDINRFIKNDSDKINVLEVEEFGNWESEQFFKYHYKYDTHPMPNATPIMAQKISDFLKK